MLTLANGLHYSSVQASWPERDIRGKWQSCEYGPLKSLQFSLLMKQREKQPMWCHIIHVIIQHSQALYTTLLHDEVRAEGFSLSLQAGTPIWSGEKDSQRQEIRDSM